MLLPLLRDLTMVGDKRQDETFHNGGAHPPKNQRKEEGPLEPSISLHTTNEGGKVMGGHSFLQLEFIYHHYGVTLPLMHWSSLGVISLSLIEFS